MQKSYMFATCLSAVDDPLGHHTGNAKGNEGADDHDEDHGQPVGFDLVPAIHQVDHGSNEQNGQAGGEKMAALPDIFDFDDF